MLSIYRVLTYVQQLKFQTVDLYWALEEKAGVQKLYIYMYMVNKRGPPGEHLYKVTQLRTTGDYSLSSN